MKPVSSKLLYRYVYQLVIDISPTTFCTFTHISMKGCDALRSANIISLYFIVNQDVVNYCRSYSVFWNGVHEQDLVCNMLIFR